MYIVNNKERKVREQLIESTMKYFDTDKYLPINAMLTHLQIGQARRNRGCYYARAPFSAIQKCISDSRGKYLNFIEKYPEAELQVKIDYIRDWCLPQLRQYYHEHGNNNLEETNEVEAIDNTEQDFNKEKIDEKSTNTIEVSDDTHHEFAPRQKENCTKNLEGEDDYSWLHDVVEVEGDFSKIETFLLDEIGYDKISVSLKAQIDDLVNEINSSYEEIVQSMEPIKDKLEEYKNKKLNPYGKACYIVQEIRDSIISMRKEQRNKEDDEPDQIIDSVGGELKTE